MRSLVLYCVSLLTFALTAHVALADLAVTQTGREGIVSLDGQKLVEWTLPKVDERIEPEVEVAKAADGWYRVRATWTLAEPVKQDELSASFAYRFSPDFWWSPHLTPRPGDAIAQHVFRSPAIIAAEDRKTVVIVPDLDLCGQEESTPWFMDYDAPAREAWLGMSKTNIWVQLGYERVPGMVLPEGKVQLGFYVTAYEDDNAVPNPWAKVSRFLWETWGRPLFAKGEPLRVPLDRFVEHTYRWAFDTWSKHVWQEFDIDGRRVGAPAFIVNISQSPNYKKPYYQREDLSIWNQAWFSSLRSASGVKRYARRVGNEELDKKADLTKEFALAAPQKNGIFPTVYRAERTEVEIDGRAYRRSKGWETGRWSNSNRVPRELGMTQDYYQPLDCSWTALLMLRWHEELEHDERLVEYAHNYADALLRYQDDTGFFPAWLHPETLEADRRALAQSTETSMSVLFLLKLAEVTGEEKYKKAALRAMDAVIAGPAAEGEWYDFETFWSSSKYWQDRLGEKIPRNAMHKQNTLSMFWTAEALLHAYHATGNREYLDWGRRTLDELSMAQQTWQPPFIYIPALGGFGVMNFDGEWNDSRQTLFAELFLDYYRETGDPHLFERGIAALKSGFVMMYCPENPQVKKLWEKVYPFFGPEDYGFTMENYGHGGKTSPEGMGMGVFTIYDWGNGAAAEARNRIHDNYGDVYLDRLRRQGFGIDSIEVTIDGDRAVLRDLADSPRDVRVVFDDGTSKTIRLEKEASVSLAADGLAPGDERI